MLLILNVLRVTQHVTSVTVESIDIL